MRRIFRWFFMKQGKASRIRLPQSQFHKKRAKKPSWINFKEYSIVLWMIVSKRFQVLFHSAHRRSFHLSLTVLVRYRSSSSI